MCEEREKEGGRRDEIDREREREFLSYFSHPVVNFTLCASLIFPLFFSLSRYKQQIIFLYEQRKKKFSYAGYFSLGLLYRACMCIDVCEVTCAFGAPFF